MPTDANSADADMTNACRVVFVITRGDSVGGAQIHVRDLATQMGNDGFSVLVLVGNTGAFTEDLTQRGVRWCVCEGLARSINPLRDIRAIRIIHRALLREQPHLVSTHTAKAGLVGRIAAAWTGVPVVFTAHGWQFSPGIPVLQRALVYGLELLLSRLPVASRVITVSGFDYRLARRTAAVPGRTLRLVYNGLPDLSVSPEPAQAHPVRLTMVARFQAQKDHATLLYALARVDRSVSWQLDLVGEPGPTSESARELVRKLGQSGNVTFSGHRSDVASILSASHVYCLISNWEGLPRSIIEAMRAGLPVIATDVGGVTELVQDGISGLIVKQGDVEGLARALQDLLNDPGKRRAMGARGRQRFEARFTFPAMYRKTRSVWEELL